MILNDAVNFLFLYTAVAFCKLFFFEKKLFPEAEICAHPIHSKEGKVFINPLICIFNHVGFSVKNDFSSRIIWKTKVFEKTQRWHSFGLKDFFPFKKKPESLKNLLCFFPTRNHKTKWRTLL